ncbi:MAG: hypothetical protein Q8R28_11160 [Dehalococcoidia bacterium]|nr:hypothetical protein [Dehalococcoidia bacterium]
MNTKYAQGTRVSTARSQEEIGSILKRFGADKTIWMRDDKAGEVVLAFQRGKLTYKFILPFPAIDDVPAPINRSHRSFEDRERAALDQELQRRFRSLANYVKAILDAVDSGIITAEEALLPYAVLPGGETVAQHLQPQLTTMLNTGKVPSILLALPSERSEA